MAIRNTYYTLTSSIFAPWISADNIFNTRVDNSDQHLGTFEPYYIKLDLDSNVISIPILRCCINIYDVLTVLKKNRKMLVAMYNNGSDHPYVTLKANVNNYFFKRNRLTKVSYDNHNYYIMMGMIFDADSNEVLACACSEFDKKLLMDIVNNPERISTDGFKNTYYHNLKTNMRTVIKINKSVLRIDNKMNKFLKSTFINMLRDDDSVNEIKFCSIEPVRTCLSNKPNNINFSESINSFLKLHKTLI